MTPAWPAARAAVQDMHSVHLPLLSLLCQGLGVTFQQRRELTHQAGYSDPGNTLSGTSQKLERGIGHTRFCVTDIPLESFMSFIKCGT